MLTRDTPPVLTRDTPPVLTHDVGVTRTGNEVTVATGILIVESTICGLLFENRLLGNFCDASKTIIGHVADLLYLFFNRILQNLYVSAIRTFSRLR